MDEQLVLENRLYELQIESNILRDHVAHCERMADACRRSVKVDPKNEYTWVTLAEQWEKKAKKLDQQRDNVLTERSNVELKLKKF